MRILVFFDLPVKTAAEKRAYIMFRKFLIQDGFFMMQESVYCRIASNQNSANAVVDHIRKNAPESGFVQVLQITEKQYQKMELIVGEKRNDVIDSSERLIVL